MAQRYRHSPAVLWRDRIANGELECNGQPLAADVALSGAEWCPASLHSETRVEAHAMGEATIVAQKAHLHPERLEQL